MSQKSAKKPIGKQYFPATGRRAVGPAGRMTAATWLPRYRSGGAFHAVTLTGASAGGCPDSKITCCFQTTHKDACAAQEHARFLSKAPHWKNLLHPGLPPPISFVKVENPPGLDHILARGAEGDEVKRLQERLQDLGYYDGAIDGDFGRRTDEAVKEFQSQFFGMAEADGKVGAKTWAKLWGNATLPSPVATGPAIPGKHYLRLTKTNQRDEVGCAVLNLEYLKDGQLQESLAVCSGAPSKQAFRTGRESISGSFEPLPEGQWSLHEIEWADGRDNYGGKVWNNGLGPAKIRLDYASPGTTRRSAIEIHIDWNRRHERGAGTAGCIGIHNVADFKTLVSWLRQTDPHDLFVDWGLGTCPQP